MANIGGFIAKGQAIAGSANALGDLLPPSIGNPLKSFFGGGGQQTGSSYSSVNKFRASIAANNGLARLNRFFIDFNIPNSMRAHDDHGGVEDREIIFDVPFLAESVNLPGVSFATTEIRRYGYGPIERKPYMPIFVDNTISFLGDGKGRMYKFLYTWMNTIIKFDEMPSGKTGSNNARPFEVDFKNDYSVDITIITVDEANNKIIELKLYDAYPIFMGDIQMNWGSNDDVMRIPVTFTFFNWKMQDIEINLAENDPKKNMSTFQKLQKIGSAVQTLAAIRKPNGVADIINAAGNAKIAIGGLSGF